MNFTGTPDFCTGTAASMIAEDAIAAIQKLEALLRVERARNAELEQEIARLRGAGPIRLDGDLIVYRLHEEDKLR